MSGKKENRKSANDRPTVAEKAQRPNEIEKLFKSKDFRGDCVTLDDDTRHRVLYLKFTTVTKG